MCCWSDIRAAEQSGTKPLARAGRCVTVSDGQRVPELAQRALAPSYLGLSAPFLSLTPVSPTLSLRSLFSLDQIPSHDTPGYL